MSTVTNQTEFKAAIQNNEPEIVVANDISLDSQTNISYAVSIRSAPLSSLFWVRPTTSNPNLFRVMPGGDLTIASLILSAQGRDGTLVQIDGGRFTMEDGALLTDMRSTTSKRAVKIAGVSSAAGGTFIMNGGVITGIDAFEAVFVGGGTVVMNNDAAIRDNAGAGITITKPVPAGAQRSSLTMTGRSRISGNSGKQPGGAGIIYESDLIMGVNEGDAPMATDNSAAYYAGGWVLTNGSTLTMRYGAEVSRNYGSEYGGGIVAQQTVISISDNAAVMDNESDLYGAGMFLSKECTAVLDGQVQVSGNACSSKGGGVYMQSGAALSLKGNASVHGNECANGAGIYLNASSASLGAENSSPSMRGNRASERGGGIFIAGNSGVDLTGHATISGNTAREGSGIYKAGTLNLSQSPRVTDGLFFDDAAAMSPSPAETETISFVIGPSGLDDPIIIAHAPQRDGVPLIAAQPGNEPIITGALTYDARVQLERSGHVSPPNVPLSIAQKGAQYEKLGDADRAAWLIPAGFGAGYSTALNPTLEQVLIVHEIYDILYNDLRGAANPNPATYTVGDLPLALEAPGPLPGFAFIGWYDLKGRRVTLIPEGTTGDVSLTAVWDALTLLFLGNARGVTRLPEPIPVLQGETVIIPLAIPCRQGYVFTGWNTAPSGLGMFFAPGDAIRIAAGSVTLFAQWRRVPCRPVFCQTAGCNACRS